MGIGLYRVEDIPRRDFLKKSLAGGVVVATAPALLSSLLSPMSCSTRIRFVLFGSVKFLSPPISFKSRFPVLTESKVFYTDAPYQSIRQEKY